MILPNRYNFRSRPRRKITPGRILLVLIAAAIIAGGIIAWRGRVFQRVISPDETETSLEELWARQSYEELNERCEELLVDKPLNLEALVFNGFSYFYRGIAQFALEARIPLFDRAVVNLRKALIHKTPRYASEIHYVLGKSYHYKGKFYADLTITYLIESVALGYVREDTYEYLGLAYSTVGEYAKSAEYFEKAVDQDPTDMRYLALAQAYVNAGNLETAAEYLLRTVNKTEDVAVEQKSRFLLGQIYMDIDQLPKAQTQYEKILVINPRSADAHYFLGEIYRIYGKTIEARAEWRKALVIDPSHYGARLRYY